MKTISLLLLSTGVIWQASAQNLIEFPAGTTTELYSAPVSSTVYYGQGTLKLKPGFDFSGSTGLFYATTVLQPVQANYPTSITPTSFAANFENMGAYVYVVNLYNGYVNTPQTMVTTVANRNTMSSSYFSGLTPNSNYSYSVQAYGGTPTVSSSNTRSVSTPPCSLGTPTVIQPIFPLQTDANVSWNSASDPFGRTLKYTATLTIGANTVATASDLSSTQYDFTNLEPSTGYWVNVVATSADGCTSPVGSAPFMTQDMVAPTITLSTQTQGSSTAYNTIYWGAVTGAIGYYVKAVNSQSGTTINPVMYQTQYSEVVRCGTFVTYSVQAYSASHSTNYGNEVTLTAQSCPNPGGREAYIPPSIADNELKDEPGVKEVTVYPNPADDKLNASIPKRAESPVPVELHDSFGRLLSTVSIREGEWTTEFSTSGLPDGMYFIKVGSGDSINAVKVVVAHK